MRRKWTILYSLMVITIVLIFIFLLIDKPKDNNTKFSVHTFQSVPTNTLPHKEVKSSLTLEAVGDVLIHSEVYDTAKTKDSYDFKPMFKDVKPMINSADIAVANQESIMGGETLGLHTYPAFNSPFEIGDALKDSGFDVVTMANNHTLDHGIKAIQNAIHYWDKIGMMHTGSFLSEKDHEDIRVIDKNNIRVSFLAYTYGTNGIPTPDNKNYLVNRINVPQMKKDIKAAKQVSDVVVVALHFGKEYEPLPNKEQIQLVKTLANEDVDIIIGNHPHVLQPLAWVNGENGHKTFVAYSLGNFISGQDELNRQLGGILKLQINKVTSGDKTTIEVTNPTFIPTWVDQKNYHIVPLAEAKKDGLKNADSLYKKVTTHMKTWMPSLKFED